MSATRTTQCPELETLFQELDDGSGPALDHAKGCASCGEVIEAHRQLEKDLFRIQDPLAPKALLPAVMARIAAAPTPSRIDVASSLLILASAFAASVLAFFASGQNVSSFGTQLASFVVSASSLAPSVSHGLASAWNVAGLPLTVLCFAVLVTSLFGLRRLTGPFNEVKAS